MYDKSVKNGFMYVMKWSLKCTANVEVWVRSRGKCSLKC